MRFRPVVMNMTEISHRMWRLEFSSISRKSIFGLALAVLCWTMTGASAETQTDSFIKTYLKRPKTFLEAVFNYSEFGATHLATKFKDTDGSIGSDLTFFNVWVSGDRGADRCVMTRYSYDRMVLNPVAAVRTVDLRAIDQQKFRITPRKSQYGTIYALGDGRFELITDSVQPDRLKTLWTRALARCRSR